MTGSIDGFGNLNEDASPEFSQERGTRFVKIGCTENHVFLGHIVRKKWEEERENVYPPKNCQAVTVKHGWSVGEARTKFPTVGRHHFKTCPPESGSLCQLRQMLLLSSRASMAS
jgi:hypothetical protein